MTSLNGTIAAPPPLRGTGGKVAQPDAGGSRQSQDPAQAATMPAFGQLVAELPTWAPARHLPETSATLQENQNSAHPTQQRPRLHYGILDGILADVPTAPEPAAKLKTMSFGSARSAFETKDHVALEVDHRDPVPTVRVTRLETHFASGASSFAASIAQRLERLLGTPASPDELSSTIDKSRRIQRSEPSGLLIAAPTPPAVTSRLDTVRNPEQLGSRALPEPTTSLTRSAVPEVLSTLHGPDHDKGPLEADNAASDQSDPSSAGHLSAYVPVLAPTVAEAGDKPAFRSYLDPETALRLSIVELNVSSQIEWASTVRIEVKDGLISMLVGYDPAAIDPGAVPRGDLIAAELQKLGHPIAVVEMLAAPDAHVDVGPTSDTGGHTSPDGNSDRRHQQHEANSQRPDVPTDDSVSFTPHDRQPNRLRVV